MDWTEFGFWSIGLLTFSHSFVKANFNIPRFAFAWNKTFGTHDKSQEKTFFIKTCVDINCCFVVVSNSILVSHHSYHGSSSSWLCYLRFNAVSNWQLWWSSCQLVTERSWVHILHLNICLVFLTVTNSHRVINATVLLHLWVVALLLARDFKPRICTTAAMPRLEQRLVKTMKW